MCGRYYLLMLVCLVKIRFYHELYRVTVNTFIHERNHRLVFCTLLSGSFHSLPSVIPEHGCLICSFRGQSERAPLCKPLLNLGPNPCELQDCCSAAELWPRCAERKVKDNFPTECNTGSEGEVNKDLSRKWQKQIKALWTYQKFRKLWALFDLQRSHLWFK